jgi:hypothetical protein
LWDSSNDHLCYPVTVVIKTANSPNQSPRIHGNDAVRLVVCHTPEGSYDGTSRFILTSSSKVSYHMLIKKDGTEATQFVAWSQKAWHAGAMNSLSDGVSLEGYARTFDLADQGSHEMARVVAQRLIARNLPCQWTTDPAKGGFCRHGDLQDNRTDPTPDLAEWGLFVNMVKAEYDRLKAPRPWPVPLPAWFWVWARWRLGVAEFKDYGPANKNHRPGLPVPPPGIQWAPGGKYYWAWLRLRALQDAQKV